MVAMSKRAELFDKAIVDLWQAEQTVSFRADATIYHCIQCVEKMIKGVLRCHNQDFDYDHDILALYSKMLENKKIIILKNHLPDIGEIISYNSSIRYKHRANDPTIESGLKILNITKDIVSDLSKLSEAKEYFNEAYQYNKTIFGKSEDLLKKNHIIRLFTESKS